LTVAYGGGAVRRLASAARCWPHGPSPGAAIAQPRPPCTRLWPGGCGQRAVAKELWPKAGQVSDSLARPSPHRPQPLPNHAAEPRCGSTLRA